MYLKIDDDLKERIEKTAGTDYDFKGNYLPSEKIETVIEDLLHEIDVLEEKYNDLEQQIEENYEVKEINPYTEYGVSERDFI